MARLDPHSFADDSQPTVTHFDWDARVDFAAHVLEATVVLRLAKPTTRDEVLDLDSRGLTLVERPGQPRTELSPPDGTLGARLRVHLPAGTHEVSLAYRTAPDASALQWLEPSQTAGGLKPYLFTQCQAIHARSLVPCQDTPSRRVTYRATLAVPAGLTAVMAAAPHGHEARGHETRFSFEMPQAIPPYLFAFAVGELASKELSPRSRVWAEPSVVGAAAREFEDVERHLHAAEALYGPYDWERFDLLVMPPSFPYGGMENPRLTFLTPTLLAGDKSLVNVVAHELAHSWTGNLVTNATAEHFWLNEGFTVFAERRILEALEGREVAELHAALGRIELDEAVARFEKGGTPELSRLRTKLDGVDPDEAFSQVPYEKGYLFLRALEAAHGRERFDALLKAWLAAHRFGSVTTDDFLAHVEQHAPGLLAKVGAERWVDQPGVPADAPRASSGRLEALRRELGAVPAKDTTARWTATEWQLFLDGTPRSVTPAYLDELDARFALSSAKNPEVFVAWLTLALQVGLTRVAGAAVDFLGRVGRMKYLKPLYGELAARPETRAQARACFEQHRARYHPIAQQVIAGILAKAGA